MRERANQAARRMCHAMPMESSVRARARRSPQRRYEFVGRNDAADRVDDRLEDDGSDLVAALAHQVVERLNVVERQDDQPVEGGEP